MIRHHLSLVYAQAMGKDPEGASPEWLFGGNLSETAKQCETVKQIGVQLAKRKPNPPATENATENVQTSFPSPCFSSVPRCCPLAATAGEISGSPGFSSGFPAKLPATLPAVHAAAFHAGLS